MITSKVSDQKWLQDPVKYLGQSAGLTLEDNAKEIARLKKRMEKAESDPARLAALARNEKRARRAQGWGVRSSSVAFPSAPLVSQ